MLVGGVAAGSVFLVAIDFVFAPWAFYFGGSRHLIPVWQGIGRMRGPAGDYVLYVWFAPTPGGRTFNLPAVRGWGYLCTPRGERLELRLSGGMTQKTGIDSNGKEMRLELYRRPWYWGLTGTWDRRPRLELRGPWRNPNLELDDGGSLSRAFVADGTVYTGPARNQPRAGEHVTVVLHETSSWFGWTADCRAER